LCDLSENGRGFIANTMGRGKALGEEICRRTFFLVECHQMANLRPPVRQRIPISKFMWRLALMFLVAAGPISTLGADSSAPVHGVDGSFLREWLVLGPFPSKEMNIDFLAQAGGEANVRPKEGDSITASDGRRLTWTRLRSETDLVNIERALGIPDFSVAYAYCELNSDRPMETDLRAYSYDQGLLWLNGKAAGQTSTSIGSSIDVVPVLPIQLNPGRNACLLKLKTQTELWHFLFQPLPSERTTAELHVTDLAGKPAAGALVQFYDQGKLVARVNTAASGAAQACLFPSAGVYDLRITSGGTGTWLFGSALPPGGRRRLDVQLTNAVSIAGQVLAMDRSPQKAIVVQAIHVPDASTNSGRAALPAQPKPGEGGPRRPEIGAEQQLSPTRTEPIPSPVPGGERSIGASNEAPLLGGAGGGSSTPPNPQIKPLEPLPAFSETLLSDTNGNFRFVNLRPGRYQLRCHGPDGFIYPETAQGTNTPAPAVITVEPGRTQEGVTFMFPEAKKGVWKSYPITIGLRDPHPLTIHRTPDGLLWIGTDESFLQTYDGVEFKTVAAAPEIPASEIRVLQHAADGALWVGTAGGMARYVEGRTETFSFTETLARKNVTDILADADGTVWFASDSGLLRFDGRKWAAFSAQDGLPGSSVRSLRRSRDGRMWLGTSQGLVRFDGRNFALVQPPHEPFHPDVGRIYEARDGAIWLATIHGAYRYDGRTFSRLGVENGLQSDQIYDIAETSDGALWFATSEGLSRFNGTTFLNYTTTDGLSNQWVRRILVDADDVLWCANGWGVSRFDPKGFIGFTNRDGLGQSNGATPGVLAVEPHPEGAAWIGTAWGGVYRIDGQELQPVPSGAGGLYVRQIHRAVDGTVWFGANAGISKYEGGRNFRVLEEDYVITLCSDLEGNLWYGHGWRHGGLSRYNPKTGERDHFTTAQGLPNDDIWSLARSSDGGIWIGTGGGLARFRDGKIEDFREKLGIPTGGVFHLRSDAEETLWIGSRLGLHRLERVQRMGGTGDSSGVSMSRPTPAPLPGGELPTGVQNEAPLLGGAGGGSNVSMRAPSDRKLPINGGPEPLLNGFRRVSITATNGLPDQHIWSSARTPDGIIWMGTDHNGLLGYDGKAVTVIDKRDGLLGSHVMGIVAVANDALLLGFFDGGSSRYRPAKTPPSVRLLSMQLSDQIVTNFGSLPKIVTDNRVTFQYREIDLKTHPEKRQFWYRVAGPSGETVFSAVTKDRLFNWTPQKGGAYSFEVQAIDRDLNYSAPARVRFLVSVPWYANAWILTPAGFAFGGLLIWAVVARALYLRKSREAAVLRERDRISRDLHDHLGAGLTHLAMVGDLVRQQADQPSAVQMLAKRLTESARELTRTMGEIIWATDPDKDTLRSFAFFVTRYAERFFGESAIRLRFDIPTDLPDVMLSAELRNSLFMVAKEALNNVIKHAQASELHIKLELRDRELRLSFEDDGRGFLKTQVTEGSHGLANMEKRLCDLGGQLQIESAPGQGTRVHARVRLSRK
jgi:signal transduction histidine kinase/ligand-binding sensor domain-containing protein